MARGWESKAVEAQQADERARPTGPPPTAEQQARAERRRAIELSLARVHDELSRATRPAHREMLERAAAALQAELTDAPA